MGFSIGGIGQVPNQAPPVSATDFSAIQQVFQEAAKVIDTETQAVTKEMLGKKADTTTNAQTPKEIAKSNPRSLPQVAESVAAQIDNAVSDVKKKKKKSNFEKMMEELSLLEGSLDLDQLPAEQKAQFEELFGNLDRIKKRQNQLKQLDAQEVALQKAVEKLPDEQRPTAGSSAYPADTPASS